jgi:hypothetical protein
MCRPASSHPQARSGPENLTYSFSTQLDILVFWAMDNTAPTKDGPMAVETLLEQKRMAAADYQESRKNQTGTSTQAGGTGTATPISSGATPRGQGETDPNCLSDIIGALGDTAGKFVFRQIKKRGPQTKGYLYVRCGCLIQDEKPHI